MKFLMATAVVGLSLAAFAPRCGGAGIAWEPAVSLGPGRGTLVEEWGGRQCGEIWLNGDGVYDGAYTFQNNGVAPPYWGAFAERYFGCVQVCGLVLDLTTLSGLYQGQTLDAYVWDTDASVPGNVLHLTTGIDPGPPTIWPNVSRHLVELDYPCSTPESWWVGYWPDWPGELFGWAVGANYHQAPAYPYANIAPGLPYPTGWHDVSIIWGWTATIGIGAQVVPLPNAMESVSWGRVKSLYRRAR